MRKMCWLLLAGLAVLSVPTQAIVLTCDDICKCSLSCATLCRPAPNQPYTTCGALGLDCIQNCGASADLTSAPAPACTSGGSEAALFAAPAPAPVEEATQPAN